MKLEFHQWPLRRRDGGQHLELSGCGVLAIDLDTGVAVLVTSERSQMRNQRLAEERVKLLLGEAVSPGGWIR
jgi:protein subunit release factor A